MSFPAQVYNVMIACPGDVQDEKAIVRDVIAEWNVLNAAREGKVLLPISWETHSSPAAGDRAQEIINKQVLRNADLLVAIFWVRLGTETGGYGSGSVEEIEEHIASGKPTMIYFSSCDVKPGYDVEQFGKLQVFKTTLKDRSLYMEYSSTEDFRKIFARQLAHKINGDEFFSQKGVKNLFIDQPEQKTIIQLSDEAKELLIKASKGDGIIGVIEVGGGVLFHIGNDSISAESPRDQARWKSAVKELEVEDCIEAKGYKRAIFQLTDKGFKIADALSPETT